MLRANKGYKKINWGNNSILLEFITKIIIIYIKSKPLTYKNIFQMGRFFFNNQ
jgi:hypothetical protein